MDIRTTRARLHILTPHQTKCNFRVNFRREVYARKGYTHGGAIHTIYIGTYTRKYIFMDGTYKRRHTHGGVSSCCPEVTYFFARETTLKSKSFLGHTGSAGNSLALGAGRRGRSEVASPSLNVFGEGGEPSPSVGGRRGRRGGAGVLGGSSRWWLWNKESN